MLSRDSGYPLSYKGFECPVNVVLFHFHAHAQVIVTTSFSFTVKPVYHKVFLVSRFILAGIERIELSSFDSKSNMLPLHHIPILLECLVGIEPTPVRLQLTALPLDYRHIYFKIQTIFLLIH